MRNVGPTTENRHNHRLNEYDIFHLLQILFIVLSVKMEQFVKNYHTLPDVIVLQVTMEMDVVSKQGCERLYDL